LLFKLVNELEEGDTLVATEVSRISRSLHQLCHVVDAAKERKIKIKCGSVEVDCSRGRTDPNMLAMFYVMGVFAELERGVTVDRINSGLESAKKEGRTGGRKKKKKEDVPENVKKMLPRFINGEYSKAEYARKAGITRPTLYKYLRLLGVVEKPKIKGMTAKNVPENVKLLYPEYLAGKLSKSEYSRRVGISKPTLYKYIDLLKNDG